MSATSDIAQAEKIARCQTKIEALEKSLEELKKDFKEYREKDERKEKDRTNFLRMSFVSLISSIIGAIVGLIATRFF